LYLGLADSLTLGNLLLRKPFKFIDSEKATVFSLRCENPYAQVLPTGQDRKDVEITISKEQALNKCIYPIVRLGVQLRLDGNAVHNN